MMSDPIQNGSVYSKFTLKTCPKKLLVPENTAVVRSEESAEIPCFLEKTLNFCGHPEKPVTLTHVKDNMGVATRTNGESLALAMVGEWSSFEGGAEVKLVVFAPKQLEIVRKLSLAGPKSLANSSHRAANYNWFGPTLARHWMRVVESLDADRTAAGHFTPLQVAVSALEQAGHQCRSELYALLGRVLSHSSQVEIDDLDRPLQILRGLGSAELVRLCDTITKYESPGAWADLVLSLILKSGFEPDSNSGSALDEIGCGLFD